MTPQLTWAGDSLTHVAGWLPSSRWRVGQLQEEVLAAGQLSWAPLRLPPVDPQLLHRHLVRGQHAEPVLAGVEGHVHVVEAGESHGPHALPLQAQRHVHVLQVEEGHVPGGLQHLADHVATHDVARPRAHGRKLRVPEGVEGHVPLGAEVAVGRRAAPAVAAHEAGRRHGRRLQEPGEQLRVDVHVVVRFHDVAHTAAARRRPAQRAEGLVGQVGVGVLEPELQDVAVPLALLPQLLVQTRAARVAQDEEAAVAGGPLPAAGAPRVADGLPLVDVGRGGGDEQEHDSVGGEGATVGGGRVQQHGEVAAETARAGVGSHAGSGLLLLFLVPVVVLTCCCVVGACLRCLAPFGPATSPTHA